MAVKALTKILIIGGYGVFGGRLCELVSDIENLTVFVGGRTLSKAEKHCIKVDQGLANFIPIKLDRDNIGVALNRYDPDIVIDASGPFTLNRPNPFGVIEACITAKTHYLDLADGSDFVMGVSNYDEAAKAAKIAVISGLSTCPALTGAVINEIAKEMTITDIEMGVAPSPFAGMGLSVIKTIFSYAGAPIKLVRHGKFIYANALTEHRSATIAPPNSMPLHARRFALVDAPDLQIFKSSYPNFQNIWMGAGTQPEFMLRMLIILSKFRALFRLPDFGFLSGFGHWFLNTFRFGEHRGGLYIKVKGRKDEIEAVREWHLIAEGDDGPMIPSMAAAAVIKNIIDGQPMKPGARSADRELRIRDFEPFFNSRKISFGWRTPLVSNDVSIFESVLDQEFSNLAEALKTLHKPSGKTIWKGEAETQGPANIFGKIAGLLAGVSVSDARSSVTVCITPHNGGETWQRDFGGRKFKSHLKPGLAKNEYLMMESFGAIKVAMAIFKKGETLRFVPRRWFLFGLPMPKALLPYGDTFEYQEDGKFWFNVSLNVPLAGRVASYKGWLQKKEN